MKKIRILTYHRIGFPREGSFEKLTVPPPRFAGQLRLLRLLRCGFAGLDLVESWLEDGNGSFHRPMVLTFDDAYADLYDHAFPLLQRLKIPAVVFLVANRNIDEWTDWGRRGPLELLSWDKAGKMADGGVEIGSHTLTHPYLTRCEKAELQAEVGDSRKIIEDRLGRAVNHFCYPYGDWNERVMEAVGEAGYKTACTTDRGAVVPGTHPLKLPRLTVGKRMGHGRFLMRVLFRHG